MVVLVLCPLVACGISRGHTVDRGDSRGGIGRVVRGGALWPVTPENKPWWATLWRGLQYVTLQIMKTKPISPRRTGEERVREQGPLIAAFGGQLTLRRLGSMTLHTSGPALNGMCEVSNFSAEREKRTTNFQANDQERVRIVRHLLIISRCTRAACTLSFCPCGPCQHRVSKSEVPSDFFDLNNARQNEERNNTESSLETEAKERQSAVECCSYRAVWFFAGSTKSLFSACVGNRPVGLEIKNVIWANFALCFSRHFKLVESVKRRFEEMRSQSAHICRFSSCGNTESSPRCQVARGRESVGRGLQARTDATRSNTLPTGRVVPHPLHLY